MNSCQFTIYQINEKIPVSNNCPHKKDHSIKFAEQIAHLYLITCLINRLVSSAKVDEFLQGTWLY